MRCAVLLLTLAGWVSAQNPDGVQSEKLTADQIMAEVAKNQDRAAAARAEYVYHQSVLVRMKRTNGKLAREETRDYTVTPTAAGAKRELLHLDGKIGEGKNVITYDKPEFRHKGIDIDGELVQSFADDFGHEKDSKDGVDNDVFPLRSKKQNEYQFALTGLEKYEDRDVYHVEFKPRKKGFDDDENCWAGEALVDKTEFEPVLVATHMTCKIPVLVKTMLGTNVQQLGFKITYKKLEDGVWFPVSYGGEFRFRAVFMYARTVGIGLVNSDFHRTKVDTAIKYEEMKEQQ